MRLWGYVLIFIIIVIIVYPTRFAWIDFVKGYHGEMKLWSYRTFNFLYPKGQNILDEEWDWLIILDACRYDSAKKIFSEYLNGTLDKRISVGSSTPEWLYKTFVRKNKYIDVNYISGNPWVEPMRLEGQLDWDDKQYKKFTPGYIPFTGKLINIRDVDPELKIILPTTVNTAVKEAIRDGLFGRTIIHFMQPHEPYIKYPDLDWEEFAQGNIGADVMMEAYESNLRIVLEAVKDLLPYLDGKIVITSDHGELFGECGFIKHPWGIRIKELIEVPWYIIDREDYN